MGTNRANGHYETDYINALDHKLIDESIHNIAEEIFDNHYRQPYPAKFPHLFPKATGSWFLRDRKSYKSKAELKNHSSTERDDHGAQHAARVAMGVVVYLNLYWEYGTEDVRKEIQKLIREVNGIKPENEITSDHRKKFVKYLQIAALFHDAERHGEGADDPQWEKESAEVCKAFLIKLGCASELAEKFSAAAGEKDAEILVRKKSCSTKRAGRIVFG